MIDRKGGFLMFGRNPEFYIPPGYTSSVLSRSVHTSSMRFDYVRYPVPLSVLWYYIKAQSMPLVQVTLTKPGLGCNLHTGCSIQNGCDERYGNDASKTSRYHMAEKEETRGLPRG